MLIGRQLVMGLPFWLYSYGFNVENREKDINAMYQAKPDIYDLLKKYKVDYVIIGDRERLFYPNLQENFFSDRFPILAKNADTLVFDVRKASPR